MKQLTAILCASFCVGSFAYAQSTTNNSPVKDTVVLSPAKPIATNQATPPAKVPYNTYGAVDVHAVVPMSEQVPAKATGFTDPAFTIAATQWPSYVPTQPKLNVRSYILVAANTGDVLAAYHPNQRLAPASLTKLMLLYIAEQELSTNQIQLTDKVKVPRVAWATGGSRMFLKPGQEVTVRNLISGIIVDSGNDAAVTLATHIAGTQNAMVSMMNMQAKKLGMTNTHFSDVMGLPAPNHYSSAYDMSLLAKAIVNQYPQYISWFGQKWFTFNGIKQPNFNKLLFTYQYAQGLKTGSTSEAGYSLVSTAKMPKRPLRLVAVTMAAPSDDETAADSKALMTYGFHFFRYRKVYDANTALSQAKIKGGQLNSLPVGVAKDIDVTIPNGLTNQIKASLNLQKGLAAPITKGEVVGTIQVKANGHLIAQEPAIALKADNKGSWWQRLMSKF